MAVYSPRRRGLALVISRTTSSRTNTSLRPLRATTSGSSNSSSTASAADFLQFHLDQRVGRVRQGMAGRMAIQRPKAVEHRVMLL